MSTPAVISVQAEGQFSDADEDEIQIDRFNVSKGKPYVQSVLIRDIKQLNIVESDGDEHVDDDNYDWDLDEDDVRGRNILKNANAQNVNAQRMSNKVSNYQPSDKLFRRYSNKINIEKYEGPALPGHATNLLIENDKRIEKDRIRTKDKHDRATVEQVLDPRTRMILFKLLNQGSR
ncbi:hypothetical protein KM043_018040 [Ampulex compressa]|nr:hypothetical protein KM043_018040 [Ampulex compressa]